MPQKPFERVRQRSPSCPDLLATMPGNPHEPTTPIGDPVAARLLAVGWNIACVLPPHGGEEYRATGQWQSMITRNSYNAIDWDD